ncbi:hypothetical protein EVAR_43084_1 [Eumeta japonica]|uniref:Uncharacterized protein n=1 Tax=Eumeta variegata TaxID=151549 RepID=A0A4C1WZ04_EUMVA|nr:hypothetical protein EVAR_43084_1 [Eumeta japonica]
MNSGGTRCCSPSPPSPSYATAWNAREMLISPSSRQFSRLYANCDPFAQYKRKHTQFKVAPCLILSILKVVPLE